MVDLNLFLFEVYSEFNRISTRMSRRIARDGEVPPLVRMEHEVSKDRLDITFRSPSNQSVLSLPTPKKDEYGCDIIQSNDCVRRVLNTYMVNESSVEGEEKYVRKDYLGIIQWMLMSNIGSIYPAVGFTTLLERIIKAAFGDGLPLVVGQVQRHVDSEIINKLPIYETSLNSWAMNKRIVFMDPIFDQLTPDQVLEYQMKKNIERFPWTHIGLSDGVLVKNYMLEGDIKNLTPYGNKYHNPQRNLYQTLGMKGDHTPMLRTKSENDLAKKGIVRGGWTLMTAFLDLPDTFEDQIIVDDRLKDLGIVEKRRFQSYGTVLVREGSDLVYGSIMSIEPSMEEQQFEVHCDKAVVESISTTTTVVGDQKMNVNVITVAMTRKFKEGTKITNRAGNKGVIRSANLGIVKDPVRGSIPLDVVVSGTSVKKRKNFSQLLEALTMLIHGKDNDIVIDDDYAPAPEQVSKALVKNGYREDGTCDIETPFGNFKAVCGWVFWGVSKTPEDQIWTSKETSKVDAYGIRRAGNKMSTIELRALITMLGPNNGIVREILDHSQGQDLVLEELMILKSMKGETDPSLKVVPASEIEVCEDGRIFHKKEDLEGTIHDSEMFTIGAYVELPFKYYTGVGRSTNDPVYEGTEPASDKIYQQCFETDKVYIPAEVLRRPWQHKSGLVGLTPTGSMLNRLILDCKKFSETNSVADKEVAAKSIHRYFSTVSNNLGGKRGHISTFGMAVRYPNSVKGVAVQKNVLPNNTVEIHKTMARSLGIVHGELVLCERFPCLGFPSLRVMRASVTEDPECKYVIRVSGNDLVSQGLDFDGDVIYLMSFFTEAARRDLYRAFKRPEPLIDETIRRMNDKKKPITAEMDLSEYEMGQFESLTAEKQAGLVEKAVGVKAHTGPVIALCYNLMRITEIISNLSNKKFHINMEIFMDMVGKSVFSQKHGTESLQAICTEAICTADVTKLISLGFPEKESRKMCNAIRDFAAILGIKDLRKHYEASLSGNRSKIINLITRRFNKVYFASRSKLHAIHLMDHLKEKPSDIPSHMFYRTIKPGKLEKAKFPAMIEELKFKLAHR